jgi:hypothetical protein
MCCAGGRPATHESAYVDLCCLRAVPGCHAIALAAAKPAIANVWPRRYGPPSGLGRSLNLAVEIPDRYSDPFRQEVSVAKTMVLFK